MLWIWLPIRILPSWQHTVLKGYEKLPWKVLNCRKDYLIYVWSCRIHLVTKCVKFSKTQPIWLFENPLNLFYNTLFIQSWTALQKIQLQKVEKHIPFLSMFDLCVQLHRECICKAHWPEWPRESRPSIQARPGWFNAILIVDDRVQYIICGLDADKSFKITRSNTVILLPAKQS